MTNREIAQKLGISPAALSLIVNHRPGVSDSTRNRVLTELQGMGYDNLVKKAPIVSSNNLCFIIYKRHGEVLDLHPFFLLLMESIETRTRSYGYNILLCNPDKRKSMKPQLAHLEELDCQGVIVFATEMEDEDMELLQELPISMVVLDNDFSRPFCNSVSINNQMGTFQVVEYLVQMGHWRIGYLKSLIRINSFKERQSGYEDALAHFGFSLSGGHILDIHYSEEESYRDIRQFFDSHPSYDIPDAFVCDDDIMTSNALRAFSEHGYKVPGDISIIGFNDRPNYEVTTPPLTSINVSKQGLAGESVDELMRMIQNPGRSIQEFRSRKIRIGTKLTVRESVSPPSKNV